MIEVANEKTQQKGTTSSGKTRRIKKVAVLGSGTMGIGIAAQFANIGCDVLLLDILPPNLPEDKKNNSKARNAVADGSLLKAVKAKSMHPFYHNSAAEKVTTGNFEDDLYKISDCDWVVEVIVENLPIKKQLFDQVEKVRKPGTLLTSNTSGIPIHMMTEGRSDDFKKHFCGTHFFNPVRFMQLLEVIPTADTKQEVVDFCMEYGRRILGKETVLCKDTPGFIANRIGFFSGTEVMQLTTKYDLRIEEVDALVGPAIGRPKTGAFRLRDLVGVDVGPRVVNDIIANCPQDEYVQKIKGYKTPEYVDFLISNNYLGNKTGQGFYKVTNERDDQGNRVIYALNLKTLEYEQSITPDLPALKIAAEVKALDERLPKMVDSKDPGGQFLNEYFGKLFSYVANRVPEFSDNIYSVDNALRTGYAWIAGPFEFWQMMGIEKGVELAKAHSASMPDWIHDMLGAGITQFYKQEGGKRKYYDQNLKDFEVIPGTEAFLILDNYRDHKPVYQNEDCTVHDIGDGVLCFEFTSRNNAIDAGIVKGMSDVVQIAEDGDWRGIVIGNNGKNFAVGANLKRMREAILDKKWDELNERGVAFQEANMRLRYSKIPVVAAIQGFAVGGGCEIPLHCDHVVAAGETYIGLVEAGVGLLPGAAGTKEMTRRASDEFGIGDPKLPTLSKYFQNLATGAVSRSGPDAFHLGYLKAGKDSFVANKDLVLREAKKKVLEAADNYVAPSYRTDITVLGRQGLATLYTAISSYKLAGYMSDHDVLIARKIAWVMCGGDLTGEQQVSERYLMGVEREAFMSLAGEPKTLERIEHMLKTGKPLRN